MKQAVRRNPRNNRLVFALVGGRALAHLKLNNAPTQFLAVIKELTLLLHVLVVDSLKQVAGCKDGNASGHPVAFEIAGGRINARGGEGQTQLVGAGSLVFGGELVAAH